MQARRLAWKPIALAFALTVLGGSGWAQPAFKATVPTARVEHWQNRQASIERETQAPEAMAAVRIVFLGDSITDFWTLGGSPWQKGQRYGRAVWEESFGSGAGPNRGWNLGISGDRIEHVLHRLLPKRAGGLGELDSAALDPDVVVVLIGINNTWNTEEPVVDSIVGGVRAVVQAVHARKPRAQIVLQTLLPNAEPERNVQIVQPINRRLTGLVTSSAFSGSVSLLDLYTPFIDGDGRQLGALFVDGLHPNEAGYRVWRDRLVPFLAQLRQPKSP
jgi:lysophospholipase L1-like esterase